MIQDFKYAKALYRAIAKEENHKTEKDWVDFTKSKKFKQFEGILSKKPWVYYSKENVQKRRKKIESIN